MTITGFGRGGGYGLGRFGWTDWAEIILWESIPEIYRRRDADMPYQPLRAVVDAIKPHLEDIRVKISEMWKLRDPYEVPLELLDHLGYEYDQVTDENKSEDLRRSAVSNAPRLYVTKGTDKGYTVLGGMEGYTTEVIGRWESPCKSGYLTDNAPSRWVPLYDDIPADTTYALFDDFVFSDGDIPTSSLVLRFNSSTSPPVLTLDSVTRTNRDISVTLGTIGPTTAPFDLSTHSASLMLPIYPGYATITGRVGGIDTSASVSISGLISGDLMDVDGTLDFNTGAMTGTTVDLDAGSSLTFVYNREYELTPGVDYTFTSVSGEITLAWTSISGDSYRANYTVLLPCDMEFADKYDLYPISLYPVRCTSCRSHHLILRVTRVDPSGSIERLVDRVTYYKPIHVELGLREAFADETSQATDLWGDKVTLGELTSGVSEATSVSFVVGNYWIIDDTSTTFDEPNYGAVIA